MMHFNDVLGGGGIYPITCLQGNWKSVPQQGCILINCTGPIYS